MCDNGKMDLIKTKQTQHWIYIGMVSTETRMHFKVFNLYVIVHYKEKEEC